MWGPKRRIRRETAPIDLEILDEALTRLESLVGVSAEISRLRAERLKRPRSTVYRITDPSWPPEVRVFYKRFDPHPSEDGRPDSLHARLERSSALSNALAERTGDIPVHVARVLVAESSARTIVTLGVPGRPMTTRLQVPLMGSRRSDLTDQFRILGEAISIGESRTSSAVEAFDKDRIWRRMERRLRRIPETVGADTSGMMRFADSLLQEAIETSPPRFTHGDVSPTNVLSRPGEISLIDFRWVSRLPTFDLALMSYRVHRAGKFRPGMAQGFNRALLAGYMERAHEFPTAAFKLNCWMMAVRSLDNQNRNIRENGLRAVVQMHNEDGPAKNIWWER